MFRSTSVLVAEPAWLGHPARQRKLSRTASRPQTQTQRRLDPCSQVHLNRQTSVGPIQNLMRNSRTATAAPVRTDDHNPGTEFLNEFVSTSRGPGSQSPVACRRRAHSGDDNDFVGDEISMSRQDGRESPQIYAD